MKPICPKQAEYTKAEQKQAADALRDVGLPPIIVRFVNDYGTLRKRLRAIGC